MPDALVQANVAPPRAGGFSTLSGRKRFYLAMQPILPKEKANRAFIDSFRLPGSIFLVIAPVMILTKKAAPGRQPTGGFHEV